MQAVPIIFKQSVPSALLRPQQASFKLLLLLLFLLSLPCLLLLFLLFTLLVLHTANLVIPERKSNQKNATQIFSERDSNVISTMACTVTWRCFARYVVYTTPSERREIHSQTQIKYDVFYFTGKRVQSSQDNSCSQLWVFCQAVVM